MAVILYGIQGSQELRRGFIVKDNLSDWSKSIANPTNELTEVCAPLSPIARVSLGTPQVQRRAQKVTIIADPNDTRSLFV